MEWADSRLDAWRETGGILASFVRCGSATYGNTAVVSSVDASGWECLDRHGGKVTGDETGIAGRAAADKAALALGWELEGGPVMPPTPPASYDQLTTLCLDVHAALDAAGIAAGGTPAERIARLVGGRDDARDEVERLRTEVGPLEQDLSKAHSLLTAALIPLGATLPERLRQLLERTNDRLCGVTDYQRRLEATIVALSLRLTEGR